MEVAMKRYWSSGSRPPTRFLIALALLVGFIPVLQSVPGSEWYTTHDVQVVAAADTTFPIGSTVEVIDPDLYLRSAPGFTSTVLVRMAYGTRGTVLAGPVSANGHPWYQIVTTSYGTGWASGLYLRLVSGGTTPAPTPTPVPTPAPVPTPVPTGIFAIGSTVEVIDPGLYLRSAPGVSSSVLARMLLGTRGTVLSGPTLNDGHSWYQIRTTTYGTGWASGRYLRLVPAGRTTPPSSGFAIGSTVETTIANLNLRSSPSLTATITTYMASGTRGTVLAGPVWANNVPWYQIRTVAYGTGWASGYYLRQAGTSAMLTRPTDGLSRLIYGGMSGRNEIALTFDAGSDRGYGKQILDVLKANGIKASFGITGVWAQANPDLIKRMVAEGHQIMNHTWSHPSFTGYSASPALTSASARKYELTRTSDYIYQLTGFRTSPYWRPPYGDINWSVRKDAYDAGYWQTVMWSIDSLSWDGATATQIVNRCGYGAEAGDIILMHVGSDSNDYAALQRLIDILEGKGYAFVTVEQLLR
jgi:peptidoglycan/xylan/chitin deacetylase (PgdA/CDA1 family)